MYGSRGITHQSAGAADWQSRHRLRSEPVINNAECVCGIVGGTMSHGQSPIAGVLYPNAISEPQHAPCLATCIGADILRDGTD
jgi:hypothetical protein